jgi:hypothetical protein
MTSTPYSKSDTQAVMSCLAQAMLSKYGAAVNGGSGVVKLTRV